jgi:hypothetical protein
MAQGNITQILSSKPEDRRMIFEEAAGITKYKSQKRKPSESWSTLNKTYCGWQTWFVRSNGKSGLSSASRQSAPLQTAFPGAATSRHPTGAPPV